jgi:hypothetical protein
VTIIHPDMTILDPDMSAFQTMLMKVTGYEQELIPAGKLLRYDFVKHKGNMWVVDNVVREDKDDWFSDKKIAILRKPWNQNPNRRAKVYWLEDKLFPRLGA